MKRILLFLVIGGAMFGAVFASASALNLDGGTVQANKDTNLVSCDGVGVSYDVYWDDVHDVFEVETIHLDGAANCANLNYAVEILYADGSSQGVPTATGVLDGSGDASIFVPVLGHVYAKFFEGISIAVTN